MGQWNGEPALMARKLAPTKKVSKRIATVVEEFMEPINITNAPLLAQALLDNLEKHGLKIVEVNNG